MKAPTTEWCLSKQRKISKHLKGQKVCFPRCVLSTHIDWKPKGRRTKVVYAKIIPCSTGDQKFWTAKASEAILTAAQTAKPGVLLVFLLVSDRTGSCGLRDIQVQTKNLCISGIKILGATDFTICCISPNGQTLAHY